MRDNHVRFIGGVWLGLGILLLAPPHRAGGWTAMILIDGIATDQGLHHGGDEPDTAPRAIDATGAKGRT